MPCLVRSSADCCLVSARVGRLARVGESRRAAEGGERGVVLSSLRGADAEGCVRSINMADRRASREESYAIESWCEESDRILLFTHKRDEALFAAAGSVSSLRNKITLEGM